MHQRYLPYGVEPDSSEASKIPRAYSCRIARNICLNRYHANTAEKRNCFYDAALEELEETIRMRIILKPD